MAVNGLVEELRKVVGKANVLASAVDLQLYQYDAYLEERRPDAVVFVNSTEEVAGVVKACTKLGVPFVPRGGGTNLSGGTIPIQGGVVIEMIRMNRILEVDVPNLRARVQPGMFNLEFGNALAPFGYQYLPDPASQKACLAGRQHRRELRWAHCFKYGVTSTTCSASRWSFPTARSSTWAARCRLPRLGPHRHVRRERRDLGDSNELACASSACPRREDHARRCANRGGRRRHGLRDRGGWLVPATLEMVDNRTINAIEGASNAASPAMRRRCCSSSSTG